MKLLAMTAAALLALAGTASAATYNFVETTGSNTFSFSLNTNDAQTDTKAGTVDAYFGDVAITDTNYGIRGGQMITFDAQSLETGMFNFIKSEVPFYSGTGTDIIFNVGTYTGRENDIDPASDARLTISTDAPVSVSSAPEPGAWALMLGGVGAMGMALRSRRRQSKLARVTAA